MRAAARDRLRDESRAYRHAPAGRVRWPLCVRSVPRRARSLRRTSRAMDGDLGPDAPRHGARRLRQSADRRAEQDPDAIFAEPLPGRPAARDPSDIDRPAKTMSFFLSSPASVIDLGVNIDHVATLHNARGTSYPDPIRAALQAEEAGADAIT